MFKNNLNQPNQWKWMSLSFAFFLGLFGLSFTNSHKAAMMNDGGVLTFSDFQSMNSTLSQIQDMDDETYRSWLSRQGRIKTIYSVYDDVVNASIELIENTERTNPKMTEREFAPLYNTFVQENNDKALITTDGIEPLISSNLNLILNTDYIFRVGKRELFVNNNLIFSYPTGNLKVKNEVLRNPRKYPEGVYLKGDLVVTSFQSGKNKSAKGFTRRCYDNMDNSSKKRIKVIYEHNRDKFYTSFGYMYTWDNIAIIIPQKKRFGIWWRNKRHVALNLSGNVMNRHNSLGFSQNRNISYFKCKRTKKLKKTFGTSVFLHPSSNNNYTTTGTITVTGTNRTSDCKTIQAECSIITNTF